MSRDVLNAILRHVATGVAGVAVGSGTIAMVLGKLTPDQVEKLVAAAQRLGEGLGSLIVAVFTVMQIYSAWKAGQSATFKEQVRKVEENVPGVIVTPTSPEGAALLKKATGLDKPIEVPTVVVQQ